MCANNPNLIDHCYSNTEVSIGCGSITTSTECNNTDECIWGVPFVSNLLDNCPGGGVIDICGNCTTDADYPRTTVYVGCTDDETPASNYD